jgi:hypothetical protein
VAAVKVENENAKIAFVRMDMMDLKSVEKAAIEVKRYVPTSWSKI